MYNISQGVFYNGVQSVSPAGSGNADNGLSVDPITGNYVLGNDIGDPAAPARLLSQREIQTDGNNLVLVDTVTHNNSITDLSAGAISLSGGVGDAVAFAMQRGANDSFGVVVNGSGTVTVRTGFLNLFNLMAIRQADGFVQVGTSVTTFNNADWQISGTMTSRLFILSQSSGTLNLDRQMHSGMIISNTNGTGLLTIQLPNMFASAFSGFHVWIIVNDADGIRITAFAGATINLSGVVTAAGGSVQSTLVGAAIHLVNIDPARWVAVSITGTWST